MRLEHVREMIATLQREQGDDLELTNRYQALLKVEADLHEGPADLLACVGVTTYCLTVYF